ncbi:MAG: hypothetical protein IT490_14195 [Candidatus Contendobacter sp.]|nr:hypothetical protein [Candidatus Contendobacter sp.]
MASSFTLDSFKDFYIDLGLGDKSTRNLAALHQICKNKEKCWKKNEIPRLEDGSLDESEWTKISHPWVGEKFQDLKLLCLGINMNNHGGFSACSDLVKCACDKMDKGAKRVRFGKDYQKYAGTLLFHRMGVYSALIAQANGVPVQLDEEERLPTQKEVVSTFDFLAYTNHIKCSPTNNERSKPNQQMWEHCGAFILKKEMEMLRPKVLLILGTSDNQYQLINKVLDPNSTEPIYTSGKIEVKQANFGGQPIKLVIVPHPSAKGGSAKQLMIDMQKALSIKNW